MSTTPSRNAPCPCGSGRKYKNCCWRKHRAAEAERTEAAALREAAVSHPWAVDIFPVATVIGDRPDRRVSTALVTAGELILTADMLTDPLGRSDEVVDALEAVLGSAERRAGVAPRTVRVRHRELLAGLAARLAPAGVEVRYERRLPELEEAALSMNRDMLGVDRLPVVATAPTWKGWGLSAGRCRALFEAAAAFRRVAPWERIDDDEPITAIGYAGVWTAAVLGGAGEEYGLVVYTDRRDYQALLDAGMEAMLEPMHGALVSLSFQGRDDLTREMQREVAAAAWEVADPDGYPVVFTFNTPAGGLPSELADALTGLLVAIPAFLDQLGDALDTGLAGEILEWRDPVTGLDLRMVVPGGFAWPVPDRLAPGGPEGPGADPGARLPAPQGFDEGGPEAALVDEFETALRESVAARTAAQHARNAAELVELLNGRHGVPVRALHEYDLRTFLYDAFPRSRPGYARAEAMRTSLRRFFAFLTERHGLELPWAASILDDAGSFRRRVSAAPAGPWWDADVQDFRSDVWADLDRRVMLLPDDWGGDLEPAPFTGIREARLNEDAQRRWLVWRDALIREGTDSPGPLRDALAERLLDWLREHDDEDDRGAAGRRTRLEVIRAERAAAPAGREQEMRRVFFGAEE